MEKMLILKIAVIIVAGIIFYFVFIKNTRKDPADIIIDRLCVGLPYAEKIQYRQALYEWHLMKNMLFKNASTAQFKAFRRFLKTHQNLDFKGVYSHEKPGSEYRLVLANCFTEPFPSTHDMDDWHIDNLISMLMNFGIIEKSKSKDYYFHEKVHIVNHDIVEAIIMVDLYKRI